jgi:hypothetical protein
MLVIFRLSVYHFVVTKDPRQLNFICHPTSLFHALPSPVPSSTTMVFIPKAKSDLGPIRRDAIWKTRAPAISLQNVEVPAIPPYQSPRSASGKSRKTKLGCWVKKVVMTPIESITTLIRKCYPSQDCMRCVKVTYWIVLTIGGIVGIVVALAPFV